MATGSRTDGNGWPASLLRSPATPGFEYSLSASMTVVRPGRHGPLARKAGDQSRKSASQEGPAVKAATPPDLIGGRRDAYDE
jgi:hypothetical protein